jgi:extracellular elastinolytic metalloproteinase
MSPFQTFGVAGAAFSKRVDSAEDAAVAIVQDRTGVSADAIGVTSTAMTETGSVTFVEQKHKGIKFANSVANVALNRAGRVTAFGSSFVKPSKIASSSPSISKGDAISAAEEALGGKYNGATVGLEYVRLLHSRSCHNLCND